MAAPCFSMNREDFFLARSRNLDDLNAQLRHWIDTVNPRVHATTQRVVNEAFAEEEAALKHSAARALPLSAQVGTARLP